jgi:hypothetical protein
MITGRSAHLMRALVVAAVVGAPAARAADIFTLRLFNIDDHMSALVTNSLVSDELILQADFQQDTGFVDVSSFIAAGMNNITITDFNAGGIWSYGYDFQVNGVTVDEGSCGLAGISGCNGGDQSVGLVYSHDPDVPNGVVAIPEPATWALLILGFGSAGAALRRSRRTARLTAAA